MRAELGLGLVLTLPLIALIIPSVGYWAVFGKERRNGEAGEVIPYNSLALRVFAAGVLGMWLAWITGLVLLLMGQHRAVFGCPSCAPQYGAGMQAAGFILFYTGAIVYNRNIGVGGANLRPAPSSILSGHYLIRRGSFALVRRPLSVSYSLILTG